MRVCEIRTMFYSNKPSSLLKGIGKIGLMGAGVVMPGTNRRLWIVT